MNYSILVRTFGYWLTCSTHLLDEDALHGPDARLSLPPRVFGLQLALVLRCICVYVFAWMIMIMNIYNNIIDGSETHIIAATRPHLHGVQLHPELHDGLLQLPHPVLVPPRARAKVCTLHQKNQSINEHINAFDLN